MKPSFIVCLFTVCAFGQTAVPNCSRAGSISSVTYVIGAKDILSISVGNQPDFTNTLRVRPDGMVSIPFLNDVRAAGLSPGQLAVSIAEKLKKRAGTPSVTVSVTLMNGKWICGDAPSTTVQQHRSPKINMPFHVLPDLQDSPDGPIFPI